jgi:very-short-patch-repair endonuclease
MDLIRHIRAHGGLSATHELLSLGHRKHEFTTAVSAGTVVRVRQGWYCLPEISAPEQEAVRVGGRLGCLSAARHHGLWVRGTMVIHVATPPHSARLRSRHDRQIRLSSLTSPLTVVHWTDVTGIADEDATATRFAVGIRDCLHQLSLCQSPEWTVAAADCAMSLRLIDRATWLADIAALPPRLRELLATADRRSESVTESLTRFRLQRLGLEPRIQQTIRGVGRVDLVLGRRLVIEVDGYRYHADRERFETDRRRDARLSALGYRVLRFSYEQVMSRWQEVRAAILAATARGDHL